MKKTVIAATFVALLVPAALSAHSPATSCCPVNVFTSSTPEAAQIKACEYGQAATIANEILVKDAYFNRVISASACGVGLSIVSSVAIAHIIEWIKNAKVRAARRVVEIARIEAELARVQQQG